MKAKIRVTVTMYDAQNNPMLFEDACEVEPECLSKKTWENIAARCKDYFSGFGITQGKK